MSYDDDDDYDDERVMEVGARVQREDDDKIVGGVVELLEAPELKRPPRYWEHSQEDQDKMHSYATVKWDDGTTARVKADSLPFEDNELERKFRVAVSIADKLIAEKLAIASAALDEAEEIANKYGVPFSSGVSPLGQSYYPTTTSELYGELSRQFIDDLTGAYHSEYGEEGWQHSAVCY